jgi:hypothetical protein
MSRVPENATAMRLRKSISAPVVKLHHFRITCGNKVVHDVLAPDDDAARRYVSKRHPRVRIVDVRLMADAAPIQRAG